MTVTATIVNQYYTGIFRQAPSAAVSTAYQAMANDASALNSMLSAANLTVDPIVRLYQTAFNRLPDNAGMTAWVVPFSTGGITLQAIANGFTTSTEFTTLYPASMSNSQFVGALYWNILQRQGEDSGIAGWTNALNSGALTRAQVLLGFSESTEFKAKVEPAVNNFLTSIANTPVANQGNSTLYTGTLWDQNGGAPLNSFTLTTGIDAPGTGAFATNSPAGSSVVYGTWNAASGNTFNAGDIVSATGTNNVLTLSDGGNGGTGTLNVAATVTGVDRLKINSGETVVANTKSNVAGYTGLTAIEVVSASQAGLGAAAPTTITAAATTDVAIVDTATVAAAGATGAGVTVVGGKNVVVSEKGASTTASAVTVGGTAANSPAGIVNVTISGSGNTTAKVNGGTNVTVTTSQTGAVDVGVAANGIAPTGAVTVTNTNGIAAGGTITVAGGASATITQTAARTGSNQVGQANAVTVSGVTGDVAITQSAVSLAGAITADAGANLTINTTGNRGAGMIAVGGTTAPTGAVTISNTNTNINSADGISVDVNAAKNTTGAISVTTTATSGAIAVGTNAGAQGVSGNVTIANQSVINGKTFYGTGTVNVSTVGATAVSVTGGAAGGGSAVVDNASTNVLAALTLTGFQGAITATGTALTTVNINNSLVLNPLNAAVSATSLTVTNTTAAHTLNINLNNTKAGGGGGVADTLITDANAQTINVVDTGTTSDTFSFTAGYTGKHYYNITNNSTGTLTLKTLTDTGVAASSTVTLAGSGAINIGANFANANYATVNASAATGAITATIDADNQGFTGGSGANVITVNSTGAIAKTINGGTGTNNTLVVTSAATNYATALGGSVSGFQNLRVSGNAITGSYTAGSYSSLGVTGLASATAGNSVTFTGVAASTGLTILAQAATSSSTYATPTIGDTITVNGVTSAALAAATAADAAAKINALNLIGVTATVSGATVVVTGATTISKTGTGTVTAMAGVVTEQYAATPAAATGNTLPLTLNSASGTAGVVTVVNTANNQTITVNSVLAKGAASTVANSVNITDSTTLAQANNATTLNITGAGNLTLTYAVIGTATPALATIDASTSSGAVDVTNVQGRTTGLTITGGSGKLSAAGSGSFTGATVNNYRNANDTINTGSGGGTIKVGFAGAGGAAGTTVINLAASVAVADTITQNTDGTYGARATLNNFTVAAASSADKFTFANAKTVLATNTNSVAAGGAGATDTFTVANGIMTFTGNDSVATKQASAIAAVNTAGADAITAFVFGSDTYVVTSATGATQNTTTANVFKLAGVSGISQVGGATAALGNVLATNVTGASATAIATTGTTNYTQSDTGYSVQAISGNGTGTVTLTNLAPSGLINDTTSSAGYALTVSGAGTAGSNSLTIAGATNSHTYTTLTVTTMNALTLTTANTLTTTVNSLVDSGNTLATLNIGGAGATAVKAITDTALTKIVVSATGDVDLGLSTSALTQAANVVYTDNAAGTKLTVASGSTLYLSANNVTVDLTDASAGATAANITLSAAGTGVTVLAGATAGGVNGYTITTGANGTVTFAQGTAAAVGVDLVAGDAGVHIVTVGANSTVTLGTTGAGVASDGGSTIVVSGDTAGAALTNMVTVNNAKTGVKLDMFTAGTDVTGTLVNVASATSLTDAMNLALTVATNGGTAGNNYYGAFNWTDGNTYVIGHSGAATTALSSTDVVVKLAGTLAPALTAGGGMITL